MDFSEIEEIIQSPLNHVQATVDCGFGYIVIQTSSANGSSLRIQTAKEHFVREDEDLLITILENEDVILIIDQMRLEDLGKSHIRRFYLRDIEGFAFE